MLFSIITVTYNAQKVIGRTLDSVASQTFTDYEHIIMDGASTDSTMRIVEASDNENIVIFSEKDSGIYDAMNNAMSRAGGEYLIFLNAGDKFHSPETLAHFAEAIKANPGVDLVYGQTNLVADDGRYLGPRHLLAPEKLTLKSLREGMVVCHQALAVARSIAPMYNLKYRYSADYEWLIICMQHARLCVHLDEVVTDYLAEGTTTANHRKSLQERFVIMNTYFGTIPTLLNHARFFFRYLKRRKSAPNNQ